MTGPPVTGPPALSRAAVDRAVRLRTDERALRQAWEDPGSRVLVLADGRALVAEGDGGASLALRSPADSPGGERYFLGLLEGTAYWAVVAGHEPVPGARPAGLREVGAVLGDRDAGLLTHAVALANWHAVHPRCPRCGGPTRAVQGGSQRHCDADGSDHFPRTDPAVIVRVDDGDGRCLLGRQPSWPPGRYSVLAGFVEPGESAEAAVAREVAEECGLDLGDIRYVASQPWPFPASLMLAFTARARPGTLRIDADELEDARWFTRAEVEAATAEGRLALPTPVSIARRLVEDWLLRGDPPPPAG